MNQILAWAKRNLFAIIYFALFISFFIVGIYMDIHLESHSLQWLVTKYVGIVLFVLAAVINRVFAKKYSIIGAVFFTCVMLLNPWLMARRDIEKYKNNICQDKLGREFNARRLSMGIPMIPTDWKNKDTYGDHDPYWTGKEGVIGHESKEIIFKSDCVLDFERDNYNIKPFNGVSRTLYITTIYAKGKGRDTISFNYSVGDSTRTITRQQADSIFAAEKIQKDY